MALACELISQFPYSREFILNNFLLIKCYLYLPVSKQLLCHNGNKWNYQVLLTTPTTDRQRLRPLRPSDQLPTWQPNNPHTQTAITLRIGRMWSSLPTVTGSSTVWRIFGLYFGIQIQFRKNTISLLIRFTHQRYCWQKFKIIYYKGWKWGGGQRWYNSLWGLRALKRHLNLTSNSFIIYDITWRKVKISISASVGSECVKK
jgi:hypothetical protein